MEQFNYQPINDPRLNSNQFNVNNTQFFESVNPRINIDDDANIQFINTWLMEHGKYQPNYLFNDINNYHKKQQQSRQQISINYAKNSLHSCLLIMKRMSETQEQLRDNVEQMSTIEWKQKSSEIGCLRDEFDKLMTKFEDKDCLTMLKTNIKKRTKKRLNQKKRKQFERQQNTVRMEQRLIRHNQIDKWLESKKDETETIKMEEKFKKDADCVLYEVCRKKTEARKHLSLISALVKLRTVRDNMATQRGEKLSLEDRQAFGSVTEKLIRTWENCYQNYCKEEQNLRTKLVQNATIDSETTRLARNTMINDEWEHVLFGDQPDVHLLRNNPTYWALTSADRDLETFIAIRRSWDTFLNNNGNGTSIPIGWVIPPLNANEKWSKYAKN